jgi:hypothetical protein
MQFSVDDKQPMNDEEIDVTNDSVALQNIRLLQVRDWSLFMAGGGTEEKGVG